MHALLAMRQKLLLLSGLSYRSCSIMRRIA